MFCTVYISEHNMIWLCNIPCGYGYVTNHTYIHTYMSKHNMIDCLMRIPPCRHGAVGTPIWFGFSGLGLSNDDLLDIGFRVQIYLFAAAHVVPLIAASFLVPWRLLARSWLFILMSIWAATLPAIGLSLVTTDFSSLVGGMVSVALTGLLAFKRFGLAKLSDADRERFEEQAAKAASRHAGSSRRKGGAVSADAAAADGTAVAADGVAADSVAVQMRDNAAAQEDADLHRSENGNARKSGTLQDAHALGAQPDAAKETGTDQARGANLARISADSAAGSERRAKHGSTLARVSHASGSFSPLQRDSQSAADAHRGKQASTLARTSNPAARGDDLARTSYNDSAADAAADADDSASTGGAQPEVNGFGDVEHGKMAKHSSSKLHLDNSTKSIDKVSSSVLV